jgi:non-specific serine/threonine protein kinase
MALVPGTILGRYEIRSHIGAGGMGEVYLAHDSQLTRTVALKILSSEVAGQQQLMRRFKQEARNVSALNHPNILTIFEVGEYDGINFIATEYIDGVTLRKHMQRHPMKLTEALDIAAQVAVALAAAHEAGIVHRDIKPENIMLRRDGYVKVLDFGLAKLTEPTATSQPEAATLADTAPGTVLGTTNYMSPEQARGLDMDGRTDIWSLGVVLYEMTTARDPFDGMTKSDLIVSILTKEQPPLERFISNVPPELEWIVRKALHKERNERYQTAQDLARDLRHLRQELEWRRKLESSSSSSVNSAAGAAMRVEHFEIESSDELAQRQTLNINDAARPSRMSRANNLSTQLTPLVGRQAEAAAIEKLLRREDARLVTLTGPGGAGKTRLSLHVALNCLNLFRDGVFFVALSPIKDSSLVASVIAQSLSVEEVAGTALVESLREFLREKEMLLVVDNFEQVIAASPLISDLLASCPQVKVLATSREVLRLSGEHEYAVPPLALPDPKQLPPLEKLSGYGAVSLFLQRARAVKPDFALTAENARAISEICARLDGLPLALELAAARIKLLTPQAMLARMDKGLKLLTGGARDLPERQQTMRGAIAWSYDLLDDEEKKLFRWLSVFVRGATLEAIETVCTASGDLQLDALDGVASLVDKSLLRQEQPREGETRFRMLQTIREFAFECLSANAEELERLKRQHANFFLALAERADNEFAGAGQSVWLQCLEQEHDNIRAALEWSFAKDTDTALRLAAVLWRFWVMRNHYSEGRGWIEEALRRSDKASPVIRARLHIGTGFLARRGGDNQTARASFEEGLRLSGEGVDQEMAGFALNGLGVMASNAGDYAAARQYYNEALAIGRELGDDGRIAATLNNLGEAARCQRDFDAARPLYEESLAIYRKLGVTRGIAIVLNNLGDVYDRQGDRQAARTAFEESLGTFDELGDRAGIATLLDKFAGLAIEEAQPERAALLLGAADSLREAIGSSDVDVADRAEREQSIAHLRASLAPDAYDAALARGRAMTSDRASAYALNQSAQE